MCIGGALDPQKGLVSILEVRYGCHLAPMSMAVSIGATSQRQEADNENDRHSTVKGEHATNVRPIPTNHLDRPLANDLDL